MPKILVIEDETSIRDNLVRFLKLEGYQVVAAPDGVAGLTAIREHLPDLILCDVMMPGLDGFGVLEAIKADPRTSPLRFVFLTASAEKEKLQQGLDLGATAYVTKPFVLPELAKFLQSQLADNNDSAP